MSTKFAVKHFLGKAYLFSIQMYGKVRFQCTKKTQKSKFSAFLIYITLLAPTYLSDSDSELSD